MIEGERAPTPGRVFGIALATTLAVVALSRGLPADHAGTGVSFAFLAVTYWLVLRSDKPDVIERFGLSFGGLFLPRALEPKRLLADAWHAVRAALALALVFFPPFWIGWWVWWRPGQAFHFAPLSVDQWVGQLVVVALPEEIFYRGYLQTAFDRIWPPSWSVLGARLGPSLVVTSLIFALGHLLTEAHPNRLAVFFPALLFSWLRAKTGGVGASIVFHALCNLFASHLAESYGLGRP